MIQFFGDHTLIQGDYSLKQIRVIQQIGRGNSHVFSIYLDDEIYAMKQIQIKNDYEYQSFLKQIALMKQTSQINPLMVSYHGYFVTSENINPFSKRKYAHIIMECAEMSLDQLIKIKIQQNKRFNREQVLTISEFMISAFDNLQRNKIAHCDIKPENILVLSSKRMEMKICDVGSCKVINSENIEEATIYGTVPFLAPQLINAKSKKVVSANPFKSDVFSFGLVLLYTIIFRKFSFKERKEVEENVYFEVVSQWIHQAIALMNHDSRISEILKCSLEFEEYKRPLFKDIKKIFETQKKRKKVIYDNRIAKLREEQSERKKIIEQNFRSTPVNKLNLFKSRNLTTKLSNRTTGIDFPKIYRKNSRGSSPMSPVISPLSKRKSSCLSSSPEKQKPNVSLIQCKKLIYVTQEQKEAVPYEYIAQEEKIFVLFVPYVNFQKAESVTIYSECSLSALYHLADVEASKFYLQYEGSQGIGVGEDVPLLKFKKVYLNLSNCDLIGGYSFLFRSVCGIELEYFDIKLNNSNVKLSEVQELIEKLSNRALKSFSMAWENTIMSPQQHFSIIERIAKLSVKKLTMVMNHNFIKYEKQSRWLLPKNLQCLYLEFETSFLEKVIQNLCISMKQRPLKELLLNFSNNNINKGLANYLINTVSNIITLEKLVINISMNPIEDLSYITGALMNLKNVITLELKLNSCNIEAQTIFQTLYELKYLFDQKMKILKISYDRNMKKTELLTKIQEALHGFKGLKVQVIGYDAKCYMIFIRKDKTGKKTHRAKGEKLPSMTIKAPKEKQEQIEKGKNGYCESLISNHSSYENYMCLSCCDFRQLSKRQFFCRFCISNCGHKGHQIVKIYDRNRCCCAYSGHCNCTQITKKICAEQLQIKIKQEYQCDKCQKRLCNACVCRCMEQHKDWVNESKETVFFECGSSTANKA